MTHPMHFTLAHPWALLLSLGIAVSLWFTLAPIGRRVDRVCVVGQITHNQATDLNLQPWLLTKRRTIAETGDRLVKAECSELMRRLTGRDLF